MEQTGFDFSNQSNEPLPAPLPPVGVTNAPQASTVPDQTSAIAKIAPDSGESDDSNEVFSVSANVPTLYLIRLLERLTKANNQLKRLGRPPFELQKGKQFTQPFDIDVRGERIRTTVDLTPVTITGTPYRYGDYRLVGAVNHDEMPPLQTTFGDSGLFTKLSDQARLSCDCDHCNTKRTRTKLFFVQKLVKDDAGHSKPQGDVIRVGGSCVSDLLDGFSPESVASSMSAEAEAERIAKAIANIGEELLESEAMGMSDKDIIEPLTAVALAHKFIDKNGYTSKATASYLYIPSTAHEISGALGTNLEYDLTSQEKDRAAVTIKQAYEAICSKPNDLLSDFEINLKAALSSSFVTNKFLGYLAYTPVFLERFQAKENFKQIAENSKYFGEEGEKITCPIRFVQTNSFEGKYGTQFFHKFVTSEGNFLTISSSMGKKSLGVEKDCWLYGTFTIKDHRRFRDVCETQATRLSVVYNFGEEIPSKASIEQLDALVPFLKLIDSPYSKKAQTAITKNAQMINENPLLQERILQAVMDLDFGSRSILLDHFESLGLKLNPETSIEYSFLGWNQEDPNMTRISFHDLALDGHCGLDYKLKAVEIENSKKMTVELPEEDAIDQSDFARIGQMIGS